MIKEAIVKIVSKEDLTYEEAYTVMNEIMSGQTTPTQNAAFLAALSTKSARAETTGEIAGCAAAMRAHATNVETDMELFEIVGTGGDNAHSFNIWSSPFPGGGTRTAPPSPATEGRISMSTIANAFANGKAFIPFLTCGDPDLETTAAAVRAAEANGADLIELGIPFSDPTAEGPVIQGANLRALQGGVTTDKIFDLVRQLRRDVTVPMVFMTYANVVYSYGAEQFLSTCGEIGIDGLILPDVPYEEKEEFLPLCRRYGVDLISLIAPTSENRIAMIAKEAEGFLYIVSSLGGTGVRSEIKTDLASIIQVVRENTSGPCAIGFGISTPEQAKNMAALSDGAIVGSAIVKLLEKHGKAAPAFIGEYVRSMKNAIG